jgi:hypothetical protein
MKAFTSLMNQWALPDRTDERVQVTLRLNVNQYAKLHALKAVYPKRAVNDFMNDIIEAGVNEIIEALPSWTVTEEEASAYAESEDEYDAIVGSKTGPRVTFDQAYAEILNTKPTDEAS